MSPRHNATRALAAGLTAAALAAPSALADNLRSDTRDPATAQAQQRTDAVTGGVRAPGQRTRQHATRHTGHAGRDRAHAGRTDRRRDQARPGL